MALKQEPDINESRRYIDRITADRMVSLENRLSDLEARLEKDISNITNRLFQGSEETKLGLKDVNHNIEKVLERQTTYEPILKSLKSLLDASTILKWCVVGLIACFAAIGTINSGYSTIVKIFTKTSP